MLRIIRLTFLFAVAVVTTLFGVSVISTALGSEFTRGDIIVGVVSAVLSLACLYWSTSEAHVRRNIFIAAAAIFGALGLFLVALGDVAPIYKSMGIYSVVAAVIYAFIALGLILLGML